MIRRSALPPTCCFASVLPANAAPAPSPHPRELARQAISGLQLPSIASTGQPDSRSGFYAHTFAGTVYVTREGDLVYDRP